MKFAYNVTCSSCKGQMEFVKGKLPPFSEPIRKVTMTCDARETEPDHVHARCPTCSPPDWYACFRVYPAVS